MYRLYIVAPFGMNPAHLIQFMIQINFFPQRWTNSAPILRWESMKTEITIWLELKMIEAENRLLNACIAYTIDFNEYEGPTPLINLKNRIQSIEF